YRNLRELLVCLIHSEVLLGLERQIQGVVGAEDIPKTGSRSGLPNGGRLVDVVDFGRRLPVEKGVEVGPRQRILALGDQNLIEGSQGWGMVVHPLSGSIGVLNIFDGVALG